MAIHLRKPAGDTLIEVIFAFAILGTIIGFAYGGAIGAHKNSVLALQRTQALEVSQYQKEATGAYRDSLPWNNEGGVFPSFVNGGAANAQIDLGVTYCFKNTPNPPNRNQWQLIEATSGNNCDALVAELPPPSTCLLYTSPSPRD